MSKLILTVLSLLFLQEANTISPDGKFKLTINVKEESDLQKRYVATLTDNVSKESLELVNCLRKDLPEPKFYWDKNSRYLIFEKCSETFKDSRIAILNLETRKTDFELTGLVGSIDARHQFDSVNGILIYFDTSTMHNNTIPNLYTFDLTTKKKKMIHQFTETMDMEFPEIKRIEGKRQIRISYNDCVSGKRMTRQIAY
jgi:hypothetical protein